MAPLFEGRQQLFLNRPWMMGNQRRHFPRVSLADRNTVSTQRVGENRYHRPIVETALLDICFKTRPPGLIQCGQQPPITLLLLQLPGQLLDLRDDFWIGRSRSGQSQGTLDVLIGIR